MKKILRNLPFGFAALAMLSGFSQGCNKFLDVVPDDGLATVEMSFNLRSTAIRYLATCYSYMTDDGNTGSDPGLLAGDELWDLWGRIVSNTKARVPNTMFYIARGYQSASVVYGWDWSGMYEGIRCCDILVDNIDRVPDMTDDEKEQWKAEVTFLKAYYHFNLIRKWGPVPVIRQSLPIDSDVGKVRVYRDNIDDCFDYVLDLLDEAMPYLPLVNPSPDEYGRVTQPACAALKARVAVYAASPLFNGNEEEASLVDNRGVRLFPAKTPEQKLERWKDAMEACEDALDLCEEANLKLFGMEEIENNYRMCDTLKRELALRCSFNERWNSELIWGNTQSSSALLQRMCLPILARDANGKLFTDALGGYRFIGVPLKIARQFYTKNGLPIENDKAWTGVDPLALQDGDDANAYYLEKGYKTVRLNFDREPRFYASLGFDGGKWLGQLSNYNDLKPKDIYSLQCRNGGPQGKTGTETGPVTGYFPKKLFPFRCTWVGNNTFGSYWFPWPMIRLTDLYLLYAEAINEFEGPGGAHSEELFKRINTIRDRAGIPDVKTSWDTCSDKSGYWNTQTGMRDIIHRERLNELAFESQRFWDLRRWKEVSAEYQKGIYGFMVTGASPEDYYRETFIYEQNFGLKDYFWPLYTTDIEKNPNLVQNIGW